MATDRILMEAGAPYGAHGRCAVPGFRRSRRGQTAVEYLLVTVSLLFVFVFMYMALQSSLSKFFERGGLVIIRMYQEAPV